MFVCCFFFFFFFFFVFFCNDAAGSPEVPATMDGSLCHPLWWDQWLVSSQQRLYAIPLRVDTYT